MSAAGPLAGQRVVITRAAHQAAESGEAFRRAGAEVVFLPLIEVVEVADPKPLTLAASRIDTFDHLVLTSANTVRAFLPWVSPSAKMPPITVVGPATAAAVSEHGFTVAETAVRTDAEGLVELLGPRLGPGRRVLVPQADDARPTLVEGLRETGAEVVAVDAYSKRLPVASVERAAELFDGVPLGWVSFTSPRIVRHFVELLGTDWEARRGELRAVSIGRVTTRALESYGVERIATADQPTPEDMVRAAVEGTGN